MIAAAAHRREPAAGNPSTSFSQRREPRHAVGVHLVQQLLAFDHIEHGQRRRAGERRAAEGRAVDPGLEEIGGVLADPHRADGEAAAEALGHADRIGQDAGMLEGEEPARAADAALHFVEQEQQVVPVAQLRAARGGTPSVQGLMPLSPWIVSTKIAAGLVVDQVGEALRGC